MRDKYIELQQSHPLSNLIGLAETLYYIIQSKK